jgi:hypothetical protein
MNALRRHVLFATPLLLSLALLPVLADAATAGSGHSATETRSVGEFQAINLTGSMDVLIRQGAQQLQVQADDKLLPLLETTVESTRQGSTLVVRWKRGENLYAKSKVQLTISLPKLSAVVASGSGDIQLEPYTTPALLVSLSGSGDARLSGLSTDELSIRIAGSGDVSGKGSAGKLSVNIAGSGDVQLADLRSDDVDVQIAGSGDAVVNAQKTLNVRIAGSGDVSYVGNASLKSKVAGSGSVSRR